uniref:Xylulose kinase-1 n=1 Tax=Tanacetum cinerariifolium TaxID=118510 RepID=A0A699GTR4_TANCI|nr:hypothetical protein [Tanacetum cinerariifolium]
MAPLTFADTQNMVAYLSKSNASAGFDQIMDFLNAHAIQYVLVVNPTIYVSCIKQFWALATIKKVNDAIQLRALIDGTKVVVSEDVIRRDLRLDDADGVECLPNEEIFAELACMGYEKPPPNAKRTAWNEFGFSMASTVVCLATVDDLTSYNIKYTSPVLTQKVFANMTRVGKGLSGVETTLFALMLVQPQPQDEEEEEEVEVPTAPTSPSPTNAPSPHPQDPTHTPHVTPPASPPHAQPTATSESFMSLLNTLMETSEEEGKEVRGEEEVKVFRVEEAEERGKIESIDTDMDITLVDVETQVDIDAELHGRIDQDVSAATKDVSAAEPTMFDDEEVTMNMAQTLIKMKAKKAKLLDEQIAQRLHDEEIEKAAAREKQENNDFERAQVLQKQYDEKEEKIDWNVVAEQIQEKHLDNIKKYHNLNKKPVFIAQAKNNMIIYLKNMAGYKMEHFRDVEEPQKKRVVEETLLQESFKKLKAVEVLGSDSTQETPSNDPKEMSEEDVQNMLQVILVSGFKFETLQVKEDMFALWRLVKEKFSLVVPNVVKEKALWVELKRLFEPDVDDVLWKLERHDMFMLIEKDYPLSNGVMTLMLSAKLQVEEDSEMAKDLVMKIFMEANKPKSKSLDTSSKFRIDSKSSNKVSVLVVLDLSKVANPLYSLRDKDL